MTVSQSTIGHWRIGRKLNLERALKISDRLGGHIVQGHIDGKGKVSRICFKTGYTSIYIDTTSKITDLIAPKGSICVDGVSLTVAEKSRRGFSLMIVPYSLKKTTLGELNPGDEVNLETDIIIRWLSDRFSEGNVVRDDHMKEENLFNIHRED